MSAERFRLNVEQRVLDDLRDRLGRVRFANFTGSGGWDFGTSPEFLRELVEYWRTEYNWRKNEAHLNSIPQYKSQIHGNDVHYVHARGTGPEPLPLLLLHGWPDSFYRFYKVLPLLSNPASAERDARDSFHVVAPSLPGFAFTGRVKFKNDLPPNRQTAHLLWQLMTEELGYDKFHVAGGDGGSVIAQLMALDFPDSVVAIHLTDLGWNATRVDPTTVTKPEQKFLEHAQKQFMADGAYVMEQSTKPRSLAVALNDSPVALASWISDRFHSWGDSNGNIYNSFSKDELLTNIMIYWVTQTIGASIFAYHAEAVSPSLPTESYVEQPVGVALFPKDIGGIPPRQLAERSLNVQRWTEMPHGGHFAALEVPELFANELAEFFRGFRTNATESKFEQTASHHATHRASHHATLASGGKT